MLGESTQGQPPERPDAEDCPWCPGERTLETRLEAGLSAFGATRRPTIVHVTECDACGAERRIAVDMDSLSTDADAVDRGMWHNCPGQGTLEDHEKDNKGGD